jgi:two-component system sensor histidine kinase BaeS
MTDDLLDVMRLEEGVLALRRERTDLGALVEAKLEEYQALAAEGGLSLRAELPPRRIEASVDQAVLSRVLDNLLANAIKHTPSGGSVVVRLEALDGRVELAVADTGEGIPPEQVPRLFQKYGRVRGARGERSRGVGLGLVFCRMAVEAHGGTIEVDSTPGRGSTFRVTLPAEPRARPVPDPAGGAARERPAGA